MRRAKLLLWSLLGAVTPAIPAAASSFVFTDVTYEHSPATTKDSHYRVMSSMETPTNWVSPVNYLEGRVHMRLEVLTKPAGEAPTRYQVCFEVSPYECTQQSPTYRTLGVVEWETSFSDFYFSAGSRKADWTKGVPDAALILKDDMNNKPAPENPGWEEKYKLYQPTKLHFTLTVLSKGEVYVPPTLPPVDAGMRPVVDSGTPPPVIPLPAADSGTAAPPATPPTTAASTVKLSPSVTGGCSAEGAGPAGSALFALLGALLWARRQRA